MLTTVQVSVTKSRPAGGQLDGRTCDQRTVTQGESGYSGETYKQYKVFVTVACSACLAVLLCRLLLMICNLCILLLLNITYAIDLYAAIFTYLCRTSGRLADVEYLQTAFAFSTKTEPADRVFLCRQPVETTTCRLTATVSQ